MARDNWLLTGPTSAPDMLEYRVEPGGVLRLGLAGGKLHYEMPLLSLLRVMEDRVSAGLRGNGAQLLAITPGQVLRNTATGEITLCCLPEHVRIGVRTWPSGGGASWEVYVSLGLQPRLMVGTSASSGAAQEEAAEAKERICRIVKFAWPKGWPV